MTDTLAMQIKELKKKRQELQPLIDEEKKKTEQIIFDAIKNFEEITSLRVDSFHVRRADGYGNNVFLLSVELITV